MKGSNAAATTAATLLLATMLVVAMALPSTGAPTPSLPSHATDRKHALLHMGRVRSREMKPRQGLREMISRGEEVIRDGAGRRGMPRQRSLAGEEDGCGDAGVAPPLFPLASAKRQVPTGADPIHHNERPPSLPHRRFP